jgi:Ubiquitin fusion degradation protein UFD1
MPTWVMESLGIKPFDMVDVSFVRIKLAALVVLQPLTPEWDSLISSGRDARSVLEHEINKYSSLTADSTISIDVGGSKYYFYVKETRAEGGVAVRGVRVQDSDIKVDVDRSILDAMIRQKEEEVEKQAVEAARKKGSRTVG